MPLAYLDRDFIRSEAIISYVEVPKIALLRLLAAIMAVLWLVEWGLRGRLPLGSFSKTNGRWIRPPEWFRSGINWLRNQPTRWLFVAVWAFLGVTLLSTVLSGARSVSVWGEVPGQDGYAAYTIAAYVLLFGVVATHLRTQAQLWRILAAFVVMGVLISGYAIFQHYGQDFLGLTEATGGGQGRVTSFMGNAIFAAAVMMMTVPMSLVAAAIFLRDTPGTFQMTRAGVRPWALATWAQCSPGRVA